MNIRTMAALSALALLAACAEGGLPMTVGANAPGGTMAADKTMSAAATGETLKMNVGDRVFFDFNKANLRPDGRTVLDGQAAWLAKNAQVNVQIDGNCDDRGTEEYNIALGQRRANAVRDYLVAKGVAATRITPVSYGKDRPTALGDNEAAWAQNRNAITVVK